MQSLTHNNTFKGYFTSRIKRIFFPLWFTVVLCVLLLSLLSQSGIKEYFSSLQTYKYLLNGVLLPIHELPGVFENNPYGATVNGALWTLPVEFACYVVCFIMYKLKLTDKKILIFVPFAILLEIFSFKISEPIFSMVRPSLMFFVGMLYFTFEDKIKLNLIGFIISVIGFVCSILIKQPNIGMYIFLPYALFYISFGIKQVPDFLGALGNYSYGIYLWGFPVQQTLVYLFGATNPFINTLISGIIATLLGVLTYFVAEKPFAKKKAKNA